MTNAGSETKKSNIWIYILVGLVALGAIAGVWFYQYNQQTGADDSGMEAEVVDAGQGTENAVPAEKQKQPQKKSSAQKKESGGVLNKLKDIEVHGAKNPCTETQRMMKQCSD